MVTTKTFSTAQEWIHASVDYLVATCVENDHIRLALSGGSTPAPIYKSFAASKKLSQTLRITFFEVDERCVPADDSNSNQRLIYTHFIEPFRAHNPTRLSTGYFFRTDCSIQQSLSEYEQCLTQNIHTPNLLHPVLFDLCVLGLGTDGHTASLFPHSPTLHETERLVAHTTTDEFAVRDRLTITFNAIMASNKILLLVKGKEKQSIIHDLLYSTKTIDELPAKKLLEHPDLTIHYAEE